MDRASIEHDDFLKKTHPDITLVCPSCESDKVYFDSDLGFSFGASVSWGGLYCVCAECKNRTELDIFNPHLDRIGSFTMKCDKCGGGQVQVISDVVRNQCAPPTSGSVYLKCRDCQNKVEIWSTYAPRHLLARFLRRITFWRK